MRMAAMWERRAKEGLLFTLRLDFLNVSQRVSELFCCRVECGCHWDTLRGDNTL